MLIQKNPLTMLGTIARCWLFCYQTPVEDVRKLVPGRLELVQHGNSAFWNIVVCQLKNMRPKLFPLPLGITYWHVAYRLYVRFRTLSGKSIEGLYFVRSDCDSRFISLVGNMLTDFNFHTALIFVVQTSQFREISIVAPGGDAYARTSIARKPILAEHSAFSSLEDASRFLAYKPNSISIDASGRANIVHIVRDEQAWRGRLVTVDEARWSFLSDKDVRLEICYEVQPASYQWNKARTYA